MATMASLPSQPSNGALGGLFAQADVPHDQPPRSGVGEKQLSAEAVSLVLHLLVPVTAAAAVEGDGGDMQQQVVGEFMGDAGVLPRNPMRVIYDDAALRAVEHGCGAERCVVRLQQAHGRRLDGRDVAQLPDLDLQELGQLPRVQWVRPSGRFANDPG